MDDKDIRDKKHTRPEKPDRPIRTPEPPHTTTGPITAPKFGSAGAGGAEYEPGPEQRGDVSGDDC